MRKLFTLCLLVFSLSASAQWQQTGSKVRYVNGLGIPTKDTAAGVAADSSQILIRPADSSLYIKYKRTWVKVGAGGGTIGGSGTTNRVAKFTGATTIGNSQITDNGTSVGINQTSPIYQLHVTSGSSAVVFTNAGSAAVIAGTNAAATVSSLLSLRGDTLTMTGAGINGAEHARINSNGRMLLGTTTDNGVDRLQVSGSMNVSARASAQTLSVTGNTTIDGTTLLKGRTAVNPSASSLLSDRLFEISGTAGTTGSTQFAFVQNPTFTTPTTVYSWYNSLNVTSATTSYGLYYDTEGGTITNKWGLYFVGGSKNYLANTLLISTTTDNNTDKLQVNGSIQGNGFRQAYLARTTTYTATTSDYLIDCTSGTFTVTLFAASGNAGRIIMVKNSGTGTITVDGNGSETIDGATTYSLSAQYATVQLMCDGSNWKIISKF